VYGTGEGFSFSGAQASKTANVAARARSGAEGMRGPMGLSEGHKRPLGCSLIRFVRGGSLITVSSDYGLLGRCEKSSRSSETEVRGEIDEYSRKSRMRFRKLLASIRTDCLPLFLHLTYPDFGTWEVDPKRWKRDLKALWQRIERQWPAASWVWRLEFQKRGAPHFHIFLYGIYDKLGRQRFKLEWISDVWFEIVGSGDEKHRRSGTTVEDIRSRAGAMSYAVGYASKRDQTLPGERVGRYWGVCGRTRLPVGEVIEFEIPRQADKAIKRTMRRFQSAMKRKSQVFRIAKKLKLDFGEVMNRRSRQELKAETVFKLRHRNNVTLNLFGDVPQWARYIDFEVGKAERQLNRHLDEPF
jgi:hypothetical protein